MRKMESSQPGNASDAGEVGSRWSSLYKVGGLAAFFAIAVMIIEFIVLTIWPPPTTVLGWFTLFQSNRLLGLVDYGILDAVIVAFLGPMFVALYFALRRSNGTYVAVAVPFVFAGIASYWATNSSLAMLYLSDLYAAATSDAQRSAYLAAGQALNAVGQYGLLYSMGFFLVTIAGLIVSIAMLRSGVFSRTVAYVGIVGNVFLLLNYVSLALASTNISWLVVFVGIGAILSFVWWVFTGLRLYQIGRSLPK
jgi:hypothetical protein